MHPRTGQRLALKWSRWSQAQEGGLSCGGRRLGAERWVRTRWGRPPGRLLDRAAFIGGPRCVQKGLNQVNSGTLSLPT